MLPEVSHSRGVLEIEVLRGPHLVLADAGGDDGVAAGDGVDRLDHGIGLDQLAVAIVIEAVGVLQLGDLRCQALKSGAIRCRAP
jgi:hypothetical protein